jgi:hypothetical protein
MFLTRVFTAALHEKGGKEHEMPAHHQIEEAVDEYPSRVRIEKCSGAASISRKALCYDFV